MAISDPIGDALTRIRNALKAKHAKVTLPNSRFRREVLDVLKREGFILGYTVREVRTNISEICVDLKYFEGRPVISQVARVSKPGRRFYSRAGKMPSVFNGLGSLVLSTPRGVLSDKEAARLNVGGEILCRVY